MTEKALKANLVKGVKFDKEKTMVSHLQFVEDTLFFSSGKVQMIDNLLKAVEVFNLIYGLKVNKAKSFFVEINSTEENMNALTNQLG